MTAASPFESARGVSRRAVLGATGVGVGATAIGCRAAAGAGGRATDRAGELDEIFAELEDASAQVPPITAAEHAARRERAAAILADAGCGALLCEPGATLRWLSGIDRTHLSERLFGLLLLADGRHVWIGPRFEEASLVERVEGAPGPLLLWDEHEYPWRPLADLLGREGVERLAVDPRLRHFVVENTASELGRERIVFGHEVVTRMRAAKDGRELALLRHANALTQRALAAVGERLRPGTTDRELGELVHAAQRRLGLTDTWVLPLFGANAANPHGGPEGTPLSAGEVVLVDAGGSLHGYQSDQTRTWVFDAPPSAELERAWHAVRDAQRAAFDALRPGAPCRSVDAAARASIERAGFGAGYESFLHRVGHGIGLETHEEPYLDGGNARPLEPGMTFSDEPGIYLAGRFGIRLENIVAVGAPEPEVFGGWQRDLSTPASEG